jgi:hypothetical protein
LKASWQEYSESTRAVLTSQANVARASDVAIMDRFSKSGEWFRWMNSTLLESMKVLGIDHVFDTLRRIGLVDAAMITEPRPIGSSWCDNYAIELPSLNFDEFVVTQPEGANQDESFLRFQQ